MLSPGIVQYIYSNRLYEDSFDRPRAKRADRTESERAAAERTATWLFLHFRSFFFAAFSHLVVLFS